MFQSPNMLKSKLDSCLRVTVATQMFSVGFYIFFIYMVYGHGYIYFISYGYSH